MDINEIKTDKNKSNNGIWVKYSSDVNLLIAQQGNDHYMEYLNSISRPYQKAVASGNLSASIITELTRKAAARCILLGWDGFTSNGQPFPYTIENAETLLNASTELEQFVLQVAQDHKSYREEVMEYEQGNSIAPSDGS